MTISVAVEMGVSNGVQSSFCYVTVTVFEKVPGALLDVHWRHTVLEIYPSTALFMAFKSNILISAGSASGAANVYGPALVGENMFKPLIYSTKVLTELQP